MIIRLKAVFPIFAVILSGCSLYRDYSFESYERTGPRRMMEFNMKDSTVYPVATSQVTMVKNSLDYYTIYLKNGQPLTLRKDQIASVRMIDRGREAAVIFTVGILCSVVALGVIIALIFNLPYYQ